MYGSGYGIRDSGFGRPRQVPASRGSIFALRCPSPLSRSGPPAQGPGEGIQEADLWSPLCTVGPQPHTNAGPRTPGVSGAEARGFTLIEVMIVVVILGLLATVIVPKILNRPDQARRTRAIMDIRSIQSALAQFKLDTGRFPTTSEGLGALVTNPGIKGYNNDGYLDKAPLDPWGKPYVYISPGLHTKDYDLESYGKDGEDGGTGFDADIESWDMQ